jgi:hypothetical protein
MQVRTFNYNSNHIDTVSMDVQGYGGTMRISGTPGDDLGIHFSDVNELVDFIVCAKITLDTVMRKPKDRQDITKEDIEKLRIYVGGIWTPEGE